MTELEILERAKMYINKLANGINPLTDQPVSENDVVNNVRIARCLFFVSDILDKNIQYEINGRPTTSSKKKTIPFKIPDDIANRFQFSDSPISVTIITKQINSFVTDPNMQSLKPTSITQILTDLELLQKEGNHRIPTEKGYAIGLSTESRTSQNGANYDIVLYNAGAQRFIIDNLPYIVDISNNQQDKIES
ncbi:MAG: hypothetical protein E7069_10025 [Bacteroidales bacterium]|jgi:hypothetical protein|nr:hypothetical protein [Bacteroidales bacterium]